MEDISGDDSSLIVIHDRGSHGPYDYTNVEWEDSPTFFADHADNRDQLRTLYEHGAESTGKRFLDLVDGYNHDDTLFVFTSDHGELLGERKRGGIFGHGAPICPELVTVPTVFIGAGLPTGTELDTLLSGTDLTPTLLAAQKRTIPEYIEGVDCWTSTPPKERVPRSEMWTHGGSLTYEASSVWDKNGGVVQHRGSRLRRIAFGYHRKVVAGAQAPAIRSLSPSNNWHLIRSFGRQKIVYGTPDERICTHHKDLFTTEDTNYTVAEPDPEQLKALGYK